MRRSARDARDHGAYTGRVIIQRYALRGLSVDDVKRQEARRAYSEEARQAGKHCLRVLMIRYVTLRIREMPHAGTI